MNKSNKCNNCYIEIKKRVNIEDYPNIVSLIPWFSGLILFETFTLLVMTIYSYTDYNLFIQGLIVVTLIPSILASLIALVVLSTLSEKEPQKVRVKQYQKGEHK